MKRRHRGIRRRVAVCPGCGEQFSITYRPNVRRFQAPLQRCPACDFVGRRGAFSRQRGEL